VTADTTPHTHNHGDETHIEDKKKKVKGEGSTSGGPHTEIQTNKQNKTTHPP